MLLGWLEYSRRLFQYVIVGTPINGERPFEPTDFDWLLKRVELPRWTIIEMLVIDTFYS